MRQARVDSQPALTREAEAVVSAALHRHPSDYQTRRMLATVLLSQHRFREATAVAERTRDLEPDDAWNHGVLGDAYLELGEYEAAQTAYDTMMRLRPSAQAYARVAHVLELRGDLDGALETMHMAAEATSAHDPKSLAWHYAQLGHLYFLMGRLDEADREYRRAAFSFPDHPYAAAGGVRIAAATGRYREALQLAEPLLDRTGSPEVAAQIGDLHMALGDGEQAAHFYAEAERLEREGWEWEEPQPAALARLLAERGLRTDAAVELAQAATANRQDILTEDALAWAYFRAGRLEEAAAASARALRTGTRDRGILYHAAAIQHARGRDARARTLLDDALDGHATFDLVNAPAPPGRYGRRWTATRRTQDLGFGLAGWAPTLGPIRRLLQRPVGAIHPLEGEGLGGRTVLPQPFEPGHRLLYPGTLTLGHPPQCHRLPRGRHEPLAAAAEERHVLAVVGVTP